MYSLYLCNAIAEDLIVQSSANFIFLCYTCLSLLIVTKNIEPVQRKDIASYTEIKFKNQTPNKNLLIAGPYPKGSWRISFLKNYFSLKLFLLYDWFLFCFALFCLAFSIFTNGY